MAGSSLTELVSDRARLGRVLFVFGLVGVVAAVVVGVSGWIVSSKAIDAMADTIEPVSGVATDVADTIAASQVVVSRMVDAIESIEDATTSTASALTSVSALVGETGELAVGDIPDSLDAAIDTLPGLIDTGRIVDRTMRALSLVGVNYDPDVPLDQALSELESSLQPIPGQLRSQADLLAEVQDDLEQIAADATELAAVLTEARVEMAAAEATLDSASGHASEAATQVEAIAAELDTYKTIARITVVAAAVALLAAAAAPLLIGLRYRDEGDPV